MKRCLSPEEIQAFLADELPADQLAEAADHLNSCACCQSNAEELAEADSLWTEFRDYRTASVSTGEGLGSSAPTVANQSHVQAVTGEPETPLPVVPLPSKLGRYQLCERISQGGFGEVWRAFDPVLKRNVAIKMVRRDRKKKSAQIFLQGILEEGQKLAAFSHPGIVEVYDVGQHDGQVYIVTKWLPGGTLSKRNRDRKLGLVESVKLIRDVARAVHASHLVGLVHRDIKPHNILFDDAGLPYLVDFGLAIHEAEQLAQRHGLIGTVAYMSPEQAEGENHLVGIPSDIYSLGVVCYELLTGRLPHFSAITSEFRDLIIHEEPVPLRTIDSHIPEELDEACLRCLKKNPQERYASAAEFADALEAWLKSATATPSDDPWEVAAKPATSQVTLPAPEPLLQVATTVPGIVRGFLTRHFQAMFILTCSLIAGAGFYSFNGLLELQESSGKQLPNGYVGELIDKHEGLIPVQVVTDPPGARVVAYRMGNQYGLPDPNTRTEAVTRSPCNLDLLPGEHLIVVALDDGRFHEVFRKVPTSPLLRSTEATYPHLNWDLAGGTVVLAPIKIPALEVSQGMGTFHPPESFSLGGENLDFLPPQTRRIPDFHLDPHEVTWGDYRTVVPNGVMGSQMGLQEIPAANMPISAVWYNEAVQFAEASGKRLPTESEYEFAATFGGTRRFPWGNDVQAMETWNYLEVGNQSFDRIDAGVPVIGLFSNVAEWTSSKADAWRGEMQDPSVTLPRYFEGFYIVRGGPPSLDAERRVEREIAAGPRRRFALPTDAMLKGVGFRRARSAKPRLNSGDLEKVLSLLSKPTSSKKLPSGT